MEVEFKKGNKYYTLYPGSKKCVVESNGVIHPTRKTFEGKCIFDESEFRQEGKFATNWDSSCFLLYEPARKLEGRELTAFLKKEFLSGKEFKITSVRRGAKISPHDSFRFVPFIPGTCEGHISLISTVGGQRFSQYYCTISEVSDSYMCCFAYLFDRKMGCRIYFSEMGFLTEVPKPA